MLPEVGQRKLAAVILFTALAFIGGGGLVYVGKISGDNLVSFVWAAGTVVAAYLGANVANAWRSGK
jgi:hypothetical protein